MHDKQQSYSQTYNTNWINDLVCNCCIITDVLCFKVSISKGSVMISIYFAMFTETLKTIATSITLTVILSCCTSLYWMRLGSLGPLFKTRA